MSEWFHQRYIQHLQRNFHNLINGHWEMNGIGDTVHLVLVDRDRSIVDPVAEEIVEYYFREEIELRCAVVPKEDAITYNEVGANVHEHHVFFFDAYTFATLGILDVTHKKFPEFIAEHFIRWNGDLLKIVTAYPKGIAQQFPIIIYIVVDKNPMTK
jgi:hypothetical protein